MKKVFESFKDIINESKDLKKLLKTNIPKIEKSLGVELGSSYSSVEDNNPDEEYGHFESFALYFGKFDEDIVYSPIMLNIYENGTFQFFFDATPLGFKSTGHTNREIGQMSATLSEESKDLSILFKNSKAIMKDLEAVYREEYGDDIDESKINEALGSKSINESKVKLGSKSKKFTKIVSDWEWFTDVEDSLRWVDLKDYKNFNPDNSIVVFSGAVSSWRDVIKAAKKVNLNYIEFWDSEETGEEVIIFDARQ